MKQVSLPLLVRLDGPAVAPGHLVALASTYRDAVRLAWANKRIHFATLRQLAAETGMPPQHVSDYLNGDDKTTRRSLPPERIAAFEAFVGNCIVSQCVAHQANLTVLEEVQASKACAVPGAQEAGQLRAA